MVGSGIMIPGKYIAGGIAAIVVISISLTLIGKFQSMAEANGTLEAQKNELKQSLLESEAENQNQADQLTHLTEIFVGTMDDRNKAEGRAKHWENKYSEAVETDEDCKKWDITQLPSCVIRMYHGRRETDNSNKTSEGGSTGVPDRADTQP